MVSVGGQICAEATRQYYVLTHTLTINKLKPNWLYINTDPVFGKKTSYFECLIWPLSCSISLRGRTLWGKLQPTNRGQSICFAYICIYREREHKVLLFLHHDTIFFSYKVIYFHLLALVNYAYGPVPCRKLCLLKIVQFVKHYRCIQKLIKLK